MDYLHTDIEVAQESKLINGVSGDCYDFIRTNEATYMILFDGKGSGVKANIAANTSLSRLKKLIKNGFSLEKACVKVAKTLTIAATDDKPYACFSVVEFINTGVARAFCFNTPSPIVIKGTQATEAISSNLRIDGVSLKEYYINLGLRESVMIFSDGVTEAGLGNGLPSGFGIEGAIDYLELILKQKIPIASLPDMLLQKTEKLSGKKFRDDTTILCGTTRRGSITNIFSGPPKNKSLDVKFVNDFLNLRGLKVICGGTSAEIVSNITDSPIQVSKFDSSALSPPIYKMKGVDLVTEGEIMLNRLYNVIDYEEFDLPKDNSVRKFLEILNLSDRINFYVGDSINEGKNELEMKLVGLHPRKEIINKIAKKLLSKGKLITVNQIV